MLEHELNCVGFSWSSSPALTELEQLTMDWLADCFGLPDVFKFRFLAQFRLSNSEIIILAQKVPGVDVIKALLALLFSMHA